MPLENLYSLGEAARKLGGISIWTVRAWLSQGRLRPTKVGRRTMVSERELERFLAECSKPGAKGHEDKA